jgi:Meiotically up-regulated gene 113
VPLGKDRFTRLTGIYPNDWLPYWSRFSDLQRAAGFEPNRLQAAYTDEHLSTKLIELTRELGRLPTRNEVKTKAHNDANFPRVGAFQRFGFKAQRIAKLAAYCQERPEYADITALLEPLLDTGAAQNEQDLKTHDEASRYGFVYLVKGHPGEYKIGKTTLVDRRVSELGVMAAVEQVLIHEIKTDDPAGVERYWHNRFQDKNMRGEWFRLSPADVKAFKRWRRIY